MENFISVVFSWIGDNESVLSGIVAIVVLIGLVTTGVRRFTNRSQEFKTTTGEYSTIDSGSEPLLVQKIIYCQTSDGARIAYAETGEGLPIVRSLGWFTHLEFEWSSPLGRGFWERISRQHRLIRYDGRGIGLSEATTEFSAETRLKDLEAVVDAAGLDKFTLMGLSEGSRTAIRYVTKHPDRVSHLILYGSAVWKQAKMDDELSKISRIQLSMIEVGWGKASYRKMLAELFVGLKASPEQIDYMMELQKLSASREEASAYYRSLLERDQSFSLAKQINIPTLILHAEDDQMVPFQNSLDLAAEIRDAQLKPLVGDCHLLLMQSARSEEYIDTIEAFLGNG